MIYWDPIFFHGTNEPLQWVRKTILLSANEDERYEQYHERLRLQGSSQQSFRKDAERVGQSRYREYVYGTLV